VVTHLVNGIAKLVPRHFVPKPCLRGVEP
jgi:hypothetical protein